MSDAFDVVVIGAGLSGLMAGVQAAQRGLSVLVLDRTPAVGGKYCYTSMGAAAVSNSAIDVSRFQGREARFASDALAAFDLHALRDWFTQAGVELVDGPHYGLVRPAGGGGEVVAALVDALEAAGGELRAEAEVRSVKHGKGGFRVDGLKARAVVLAAGGSNLPQLGGGDRGYRIAQSLGHQYADAAPNHVPVDVAEEWPHMLPGLWMDVDLSLQAGRKPVEATGSVLFTAAGLTGEAVFNVSGAVEPGCRLTVNFHPGMSHDEVAQRLFRVFGERTREPAEVAIDYIVPASLGRVFLDRQRIKHGARVMQLDEQHRQALVADMHHSALTVTGTLGMNAAEACSGGVSVREVDPRTFASRKHPGLYIVGRVLDVSAAWGGFEQHFALASGFVAGRAIEL